MIVLALDPGQCTGYALAAKDDGTFDICYGQESFSHRELYDFIPPNVEHVICESFEFRQGRQLGVDLYPCELIGVVSLWYQYSSLALDLTMQPASIQGKKAYFSDARLKDMDLYQKGIEHGRSAVKHLLQWFYYGAGYQYLTTDQDPELVEEDWFRSKYLEGG